MQFYLIDAGQLRYLESLQKRLHTERTMGGDEMRDTGHALEAILAVVRQLPVPEDQ